MPGMETHIANRQRRNAMMARFHVVKKFFEDDDGRQVTLTELKQLSERDLDELFQLGAEALGINADKDAAA
jgi:hypothetical protein